MVAPKLLLLVYFELPSRGARAKKVNGNCTGSGNGDGNGDGDGDGLRTVPKTIASFGPRRKYSSKVYDQIGFEYTISLLTFCYIHTYRIERRHCSIATFHDVVLDRRQWMIDCNRMTLSRHFSMRVLILFAVRGLKLCPPSLRLDIPQRSSKRLLL